MRFIRMPKVEGETRKEKIKRKINNGLAWCEENKDLLILATPIVILGIKKGSSMYKARLNHLDKDLTIYDNRLGHYWRLKRVLSNREYLEIDRRKQLGEPLSEILADLKVLK